MTKEDNSALYATLSKDELIRLLLVADSHLLQLREYIKSEGRDNG